MNRVPKIFFAILACLVVTPVMFGQSVTLNWGNSPTPGIAGYTVERAIYTGSIPPASAFTPLNTTLIPGLTFTDSTVVSVPPVISSLSISSAPVGSTVTITGTGFGVAQGTVAFNATPAIVSSWSATSIVVTVPIGAITGNVVVTTPNGFAYVYAVTSSCPPGGCMSGGVVVATGTSVFSNELTGSSPSVTSVGVPFTVTTAPPPVAPTLTITVNPVASIANPFPTGTLFNLYCSLPGGPSILVNGAPFTASSYLMQPIPSGTTSCQAAALVPGGTAYVLGPAATISVN